MISQIARIQSEEAHHDDTHPLAPTVTARSEERERRRRARAARAPFQEPLMALTEAADRSRFTVACHTPLPDSDDEEQLEFGCQFPHQCGHRGRPCAAACPNNPVPPVEKKRPARKVTSAKKANRMPSRWQSKVLEAIKSKNGEWTSLPDIKKWITRNCDYNTSSCKNWKKINQALREMTASRKLIKQKGKWREPSNYQVVIGADGRKALRRSTRRRRAF